ncbi:MAG: LPS assembly protein LptD [Opitutaceae bacterium]|nr:LPS assembly protein LptD [Opitutaceae bacterium]
MIRRFVLLLSLVASVLAQTPPPAVPPAAPTLSGDHMEGSLDSTSGVALLRGNTVFRDRDMLLQADEMRVEWVPIEGKPGTYATKTTSTGRVVFTRGGNRLLADRLVYQQSDGSFSADSIRLGSYPYFAEAYSATGTRTEITLKRARVSYGEPGPWQPTINADTLVFSEDKQLRSENVTIGIGHAQPVPIPRYEQNMRAPLFAGALSLDGGFRRSLGAFAEASLLIPIRPGVRLGPDVGLYTERGLMFGPAARYSDSKDTGRFRGHFRSGYIHDNGDKGTDLIGRPVPEDRAFAEWQHEQVLTERLKLAAQLNWWKDSEVVRDFRPRNFFPVQEPDTFVESTYQGPHYFLSAFARFQPNDFHVVQQRLPEISFDLLPRAMGRGFYERFHASAAVLHEEPLPPGPANFSPRIEQRTNRLDGYYAIERPIVPTDWLAITPIAGVRMTHYDHSRGLDQRFSLPAPPDNVLIDLPEPLGARATRLRSYTRVLGEVGADAVLRASGTFDYRNPQWKIDGLRHLITPRLSYRNIPRADRGRAYIPRIDRQSFSTYLQPLGLGDVRNIDDLRRTNTLRLSLDNILQTRDAEQNTRDLLSFNIANDFRFRPGPGERDVSEIHTELSLTPARWLQVDVYESFAPQSMQLREFNSAITIRDGRAWELRFTNNFLRHQIEDYAIDGRFRINEAFQALTRLHYDVRRRRFNEQMYGIAHNLGNTWLVSYTVSLYSGRRRESSFGFNVRVDTVRF